MIRTLIILCALGTCCATTSLKAEETHEKWLKYMSGEWKFTLRDMEGQTSITPLKSVNGLILKAEATNGDWALMGVIGWHADEKKFVETDYSSGDSWSRREFTKITDNAISGTHKSFVNGGVVNGKLEYRRINNDRMQLVADQPGGGGKITVDFVRIPSRK